MKAALALLVLVCAACGAIAPAPVAGSPLTTSQLKFRVMDAAGKPVYCDPDFYPVAREGGEQANAIAQYSAIKADAEAYGAIVAHEGLPAADLSDAQKVVLYRAWKLLRAVALTAGGGAYSFKYSVQTTGGGSAYQMVAGTVRVDGFVTVSSRTASRPPMCPICLDAGTMIATPGGAVAVTEIKPGLEVWSETAAGVRIAAPVVEIGSMAVPSGHLMVHLRLADGRELMVSPGHPTADGRRAGALRAGDELDGSTITLWELVPYTADRTYDILPAGGTGEYWANGILMGSTLSPGCTQTSLRTHQDHRSASRSNRSCP
ncbi:MAG TPA: hypothetical protein VLU92_09545 [Candidatus Dormibacteraeota bacterium]|nr:hypothetical protein [Candidatus Dormibacteraeota bacterium]